MRLFQAPESGDRTRMIVTFTLRFCVAIILVAITARLVYELLTPMVVAAAVATALVITYRLIWSRWR